MPKERVRLASAKPCRTSPGSDLYGRPSSQASHTTTATFDAEVDVSSMTSSVSSPSSSSSDVTSGGDGTLSAAESAQTNLIVNYLPQTMSQEDMKSLFASVGGDMESCRLIRDKSTGQSLGYGFVKYKAVETASRAITLLNGLRLQNKTIKVSVARPSSDCIKGANLYVGGLPKHITNQDLVNWFSPSGQIVTARVLCDPQSGLTRGVGFVRFNLKSEAETAIRLLSGTIPPGTTEPITVKFANQPTVAKTTIPTAPKAVPVSAAQAAAVLLGNGQLPSASAMLAHQNAQLGIRYSAMPPIDPLLMTSFPVPGASSPPQCGATVTVTNLPGEADENVLCRLFGSFGAVQSVYLLPGQRVALVTMFNYVDALNAVSGLNGLTLNGCTIQVSAASSGTAPVDPNHPCQLALRPPPQWHGLALDCSARMMHAYFIPSIGLHGGSAVHGGMHDVAAAAAAAGAAASIAII